MRRIGVGLGLALALAACGTVKVDGDGDRDGAGEDVDGAGGAVDGAAPPTTWTAIGSDLGFDLTAGSVKVGGYDGRVYYALEGQAIGGTTTSRVRSLDVNAGDAREELAQRADSNDLCSCGYDGQLTAGPDGLYYVANYAQRYTPTAGWQVLDYPDTVQRGEAAAVFVAGQLWLMGGRGPLNTTVVLEPVFEQWSFGPDLPEATAGAAAVFVDDLGLLLFGGDASPHGIQHLDRTDGSGRWVTVDAPIPGDGGRFAVAALSGERVYLYASGGSRLRVFDPFAIAWESTITLPDGTVGVTEVGGSIYAVAAQLGEVDVYRLDR